MYDPSYGAGPYDIEILHENAAIDGISHEDGWVLIHDPAVQELKYD